MNPRLPPHRTERGCAHNDSLACWTAALAPTAVEAQREGEQARSNTVRDAMSPAPTLPGPDRMAANTGRDPAAAGTRRYGLPERLFWDALQDPIPGL
jgi:hypothetical protein